MEEERKGKGRKGRKGGREGGKEGRQAGRDDLKLLFKTSVRMSTARKPGMLCDSVQCVIFNASQVFKTVENRLGKHMYSSSPM